MDWVQFAILFLTLVGFIWTSRQEIREIREEARNDWKHLDAKFDLFKDEMKRETKDFHGRLCALEEKYIQMMEKYWESKK